MNFLYLLIYLFASIFLFWEITNFIIWYKSFLKFLIFMFVGLLFIFRVTFEFFLIEFPIFLEYILLGLLLFIVVSFFYLRKNKGVRL